MRSKQESADVSRIFDENGERIGFMSGIREPGHLDAGGGTLIMSAENGSRFSSAVEELPVEVGPKVKSESFVEASRQEGG